ncbi:MAG: radical SAM protein [Nitrospirae bacterium]|nr:radical SAM protein [Nitrospirota bacterium]
MEYVYGPVPSRRLGFSLGVDLVPYKTCTLDCIYCQLGRTTKKSINRKHYAQRDNVLREINEVLSKEHQIDYITFSGSGEPTLNSDIGVFIRDIKELTNIPVAVLTNSTLISADDVQYDLVGADVILPSLDAASHEIFKKINRPHSSLKIEAIIAGLKRFRKIYNGQIWLEVMLIRNINNNAKELSMIRNAISEIHPDKVYLNTVVRPPSEIYAKPLNKDEMIAAKNFLATSCEVIAEFHGERVAETQNVEGAIVEMAKRRPLTIIDIANVLGISETNAKNWVNCLKDAGGLQEKQYNGKKYYSYSMKK